ncbi:AraC family transcriptional regulator [Pleionea sp. CnH1-48]|uniref:helix-turn-helix domain-containing protein n=1 Tax=Pleionea sp. CnH1-48 TaxID=2954494 RepID=UPI0020973034|nr:response regulator transcription factor [Pleionea sp. CnH1-48]MCO7223676.1 helix-turn-helix transcriptional regulator [Pleionea sp. CnH1-48]
MGWVLLEALKIILAAAMGQGLLIVIMLLTARRSNFKANVFLSILVLMMTQVMYIGYAQLQGWNTEFLDRMGIYPLFIHGPVIYCYCILMTQPKVATSSIMVHFLWLLFPALWIAFGLYNVSWGIPFLHIVSFLQIGGYYFLSIKKLRNYAQTIKLNFANTDKYRLRWLYFLLSGLGILTLLDLGSIMLNSLALEGMAQIQFKYLYLLEAAYTFAIGFMASRQPQILFNTPIIESTRKYDRSSLNYQKADDICQQVQRITQEQELFLNNELSLSELAQLVKVSPHHLSQALNENLNKNFYEFINELRIQHCQNLLKHPDNKRRNLTDIALECGFNNKTSFNNAFKKHTNMTPSQFRKQQHTQT